MLNNDTMITESLKDRRIKNAEKACRESITDWSKIYWYNVFSKLCKKYNLKFNILGRNSGKNKILEKSFLIQTVKSITIFLEIFSLLIIDHISFII